VFQINIIRIQLQKFNLEQATKTERERRCIALLSLTSALDGGGCSTQRPRRFTPQKYPVSSEQEAGWATGQVWTITEKSNPHRDSIPGSSTS